MSKKKRLVIAIDGPSGTGKSSAGKALARALGCGFLGTGEMYRALGYKAVQARVDLTDDKAVTRVAKDIDFTFEKQEDASLKMFVDGEYLGDKLLGETAAAAASKTSALKNARAVLVEKQREIARAEGPIVMEGRDIGTVVMPKAAVKFYMDASAAQRALRRFKQMKDAQQEADYEQILRDIEERDHRDSTRKNSPLKKAKDAVLLDTTELSLDQVVKVMQSVVYEKTGRTFKEKATQSLLNLIKLSFRLYLKIFYNAKAEGLDKIPPYGRLIIVSNHASNVDPTLLGGFAGLVRDSRYVIKKQLMAASVLGRLFKLFGFIAVDREDAGKDMGAFKAMLKTLKNEESIVIFPEGTRSKDGKPGKAKAGVALIAHKSGAPVLICRLFNTYGFPWKRNLKVVYSHVIRFEEDKNKDIKEQYQQFSEKIMSEIYRITL